MQDRELAPTPDTGLSFTAWLQRARRSPRHGLFYRAGDLSRVKVWDFDESGGFHHRHDTQYERVSYHEIECPHSLGLSRQFHPLGDIPRDRPEAGNFGTCSRDYPVDGTQQVYRCGTCSGRGKVKCTSCNGRGSRTTRDSRGKSRRAMCYACLGSGKRQCSTCLGDGKLMRYDVHHYKWEHTIDQEVILNQAADRASVRTLITRTMRDGGGYRVDEFSEQEVQAATGVTNQRIRSLITRAQQADAAMEAMISARSGTILFTGIERHYVPMGFVNAEIGDKYGQYFIAGTASHSRMGRPPVRLSWLKIIGWIGLLMAAVAQFAPIQTSLSGRALTACVVIGVLLGLYSILRTGLDHLRIPPDLWLIEDDDGLSGWYLVHLLAQGVSLFDSGVVRDPCYVDLFSSPQGQDRKGRNSFFCTLIRRAGRGRRAVELLWLSGRARAVFPGEVESIQRRCYQYTWVLRHRSVEDQDQLMATLLESLTPDQRACSKLSVLDATATRPMSPDDFPRTLALIAPEQLVCLSANLMNIYDRLQSGNLITPDERRLHELVGLIPLPTEG